MTLKELYDMIDGDYEQAVKVLRIEKLIDKHIRRLPSNTIFADIVSASEAMDGERLFENAHAIKGVCANLGLVKLSGLAADIAEEFRPGNERDHSDDEVRQKVALIDALYKRSVEGIALYEQSVQ